MSILRLRLWPLLAVVLLCSLPAAAQKYRTALGVRVGGGNYGLTAQQRIFEKTTLEGIAIFRSREVTGTVLAERHFGLLGPSLNYYFGLGGHVGNHKDYGTVGGLDGLVGLEWKLPITRLVVSADFKPTVEFNNDDWMRFPTAISLRYVLIKEKEKPFMGGLFGGDKERSKKKTKTNKNSKPRLLDNIFGS